MESNNPVSNHPTSEDSDVLVAGDSKSSDEEGYQSGYESSTTSLTSSVLAYQYENGRRYHAFKSGKYTLPNDEQEQDRLDMLHHVFTMLLGGESFLAPLEKPQRILDIGTGTGIWALDVAHLFPEASVTGTDLSPIQPIWVLPNVQFIIDDAEADWVYVKDSFDHIHIRCMLGSIQDWPRLISQAYEHIRPGGYIEWVDWAKFAPSSDDGTYPEDSNLWRYYDLINKASKDRGAPLTPTIPFTELLSQRGFKVVKHKLSKVAIGAWPWDKKQKELGKWMQAVCNTGFEAYGLALFTRELGMDKEEVERLIDGAKREISSRKFHIYCAIERIVARKPCDDDL